MEDEAIVMVRSWPHAHGLEEYAVAAFPDCVVTRDGNVVVVHARDAEDAKRIEAALVRQGAALGLEVEPYEIPGVEWVDSNSLRWQVSARFASSDAALQAWSRLSQEEIAVCGITSVSLYAGREEEADRLAERARLEPGFRSVRIRRLSFLGRWRLRVRLGAHYGHLGPG